MLIITFVLMAAALGFAAYKLRNREALADPYPARRLRVPAASGAAPHAPDLKALDWGSAAAPPASAAPTRDPAADLEPVSEAALRETIRDRYIAVRFPSFTQRATDFAKVAEVIKMARHYFEEEKPDIALELLDLAIEVNPGAEELQLAQLEIAFLTRDADEYRARANAFHASFPHSPRWSEVARLGRATVPNEPVFGHAQAPRANEHYGPWPDTPNWIQASWDLTADVLMAEFHHAMNTAPAGRNLGRHPAASGLKEKS